MPQDKSYELFVGSNDREIQSRLLHHKLRRMRAQIHGIILRSHLLQRRMEVVQELSKHMHVKTKGMRKQTRRLFMLSRWMGMQTRLLGSV
jgi:diphthamide synthase subunit DPH2